MTPFPSQPSEEDPLPACPVKVPDCPLLVHLQRRLDQLAQQVRTDPLTGVANYRFFTEALEQEVERSQRNGRPVSLLMVDIDHFKKVNDTYGHEIGNQALIHVARLISRQVRKLDIVCRYGGEEFAVILPETDLHTGTPVAERIRQSLVDTPLILAEATLSMTVSLGLATYQAQTLSSIEELIKQADHYLYEAKQKGRNQLCHADMPQPASVSNEEKQTLLGLFGRSTNPKD